MYVASIASFSLLVTVVRLCHGKYLPNNRDKPENAAVKQTTIVEADDTFGDVLKVKRIPLSVHPRSRKCEIDQLKEETGCLLESCEDWAMDAEEFYVVHGGACKVVHTDPTSPIPVVQIVTCQYGQWSGTGTSVDMPHSRQKRFVWLIVAGVALAGIGCAAGWWCSQNGGSAPRQRHPPKFTNCPPKDLKELYLTPAGSEFITVKWADLSATDSDGTIRSVKVLAGKNGGYFRGHPTGRKYDIVIEATDNDGLTARCSFSFKVKVRTCDNLPWPANGKKVSCTKYNILGSKCKYTCDKGYRLSGSSTVECIGQGNPSWTTLPKCKRITCGKPPSITKGNWSCNNYETICGLTCQKGFKRNGDGMLQCGNDGKWPSTSNTCKDITAPDLRCKRHQVFYADRGSLSKSVFWETPTVHDNYDPKSTVKKVNGPDQGVIVKEGESSHVMYIATDSAGNNSPKCTIELEVKSISCGHPLDTFSDANLRFNCSLATYTLGDTCSLYCNLNLPLNGSDNITCERTIGNRKPTGHWDWGNGAKPFCKEISCPDLDPPQNGALVFDTINLRPMTTMLCNDQFDIPDMGSNFNGIFFCTDEGHWGQNLTKAPDCVEPFTSRGFRLVAKVSYYSGTCGQDDNILEQFKAIVSQLNTIYPTVCPADATCSVVNPKVTCGPTNTRKKRSVSYRWRSRRFTDRDLQLIDLVSHAVDKREATEYVLVLSCEIEVNFDSSNMTRQQTWDKADDVQLRLLKPIMRDMVYNGTFDVPSWTLKHDSFETGEYGVQYCDAGSTTSGDATCKPCPPGYREMDGKCQACPVGEYSNNSGTVTCTTCPEGYSTREKASESAENCTKLCTPGTYSPDKFAPCAQCKVGFYQANSGRTMCDACRPGQSTRATGSTSQSDCLYFDVFVSDTAGRTTVAEIQLLNGIALNVFAKTVSGSPDIVLSIHGELDVILTDNIRVVTSSTDDILGPTSRDAWIHMAVSWNFTSGILTAYYRGSLVANHSSISPVQRQMLQKSNLDILASGDAEVLISGFSLHDAVVGQADVDTTSTSCQIGQVHEADGVHLDIFKNTSAEGITVTVPSLCDAVDECQSSPCGNYGRCTDNIGNFTCTCVGGFSGITCNVPPDFCMNNDCANGATCVSRTTDYMCQCPLGHTGVFCETPPVNGGWSTWSWWTECTASCASGTRERTRVCDSPEPGEYGQDCVGDAMETENCNISPCPECPEPERGFAALLNCDTDNVTGAQICNASCRSGYARPPGLETSTYRCGVDTGYRWVPMKKIPACIQPGRTKRYTIQAHGIYVKTARAEDEHGLIDAINSNVAGSDCFKSASCEAKLSLSNVAGRRKRSTGSVVTVSFSIDIKDTSDLQLEQFATNGTVSPGLQELIDAVNNLESTAIAINASADSFFDVTTNGVSYNVDTLAFDGSASCSEGQVVTNGLCAECPTGSYQVSDYCSPCDKGTYQGQTGQSSCVECPTGYTTEAIGSDSRTDCLVVCPAGSYRIKDYCSPCDKGTYQGETGETSCVECPTDFTTLNIGSDSSTDCSVPLKEDTPSISTVETTAIKDSTTSLPAHTQPSDESSVTLSTSRPPTDEGNSNGKNIYIGISFAIVAIGIIGTVVIVMYMKMERSRTAVTTNLHSGLQSYTNAVYGKSTL